MLLDAAATCLGISLCARGHEEILLGLLNGIGTNQPFVSGQQTLRFAGIGCDLLLVFSFVIFVAGLCWLGWRLTRIADLQSSLRMIVAGTTIVVASVGTTVFNLLTVSSSMLRMTLLLKIVSAAILFPAACYFAMRLKPLISKVRIFFYLQKVNREQAERLWKSEEFLDRTGRLAGIGGWEVDLLSNEIFWSDETCRIHGAAPGYRPTLDEALRVYPYEARLTISQAVQEAVTSGKGYDLELPVVRFDGRQIWARTVGAADFRDGKAVRLSGAFQDVTAKVEAREALRQATERMKLATESGGIGIWDWDIAQNKLSCDPYMYRLHGRDPEQPPAEGELWRDQLHPDDREYVERALEDAVLGKREYDTEFRLVWEDGSVHSLRGAAHVTRDEAGRALHMVGANWDVTESRRLIAQLAEERELLRVTLNSIGDAVITANTAGRIDWLNPVAERLTGWSLGEAMGLPLDVVFQTLGNEGGDSVQSFGANWMAQGELEFSAKQTLLISRSGQQYGIASSKAPICDAQGELLGAVLVFHDVTEQRRLRAAADEATRSQLRLKDEFLSHVSHELRSPLTSIYSFSSIIADGLAGEVTPEQSEYLQIVIKNVAQLQSMIEDLLTVTKSKEGKLSIEPERVVVEEAVLDAMHTVQSSAARKHLSIEWEGCGNQVATFADPTRLRQVLIILLDNAVKFTPVGGSVTIHVARKDEEYLKIEIADTGCGIPIAEQPFVFEKLYQVTGPNEADTNQLGRTGLGLGLHIARDLVLRQGGSIGVSSVPEEGSIFHFTLPIYREQELLSPPRRRRKTDWPEDAALSVKLTTGSAP